MTHSSDSARSDILALEPDIIASALKMARDETEAHQLTQLTFVKALAAPPREGADRELDTRLWLFRLLRSEFHSVERQRQARRERGFTVASRQTAFAGRKSMNSKTAKQSVPMSHGPTIEDLRIAIDRATTEGVDRADMLLRLTFRDASLIKRSPSVGIDEVSFAGGDMRFLGVRVAVGPVPLSSLEAPEVPGRGLDGRPLPEETAPVKKAKAKRVTKPKVAVAADAEA